MAKNNSITVQNIKIAITSINNEDYISLTDMVKAKDDDSRAADIIKNWLRNRGTLEFLGTWESIYNPDFKVVEFDHFNFINKDPVNVHAFSAFPLHVHPNIPRKLHFSLHIHPYCTTSPHPNALPYCTTHNKKGPPKRALFQLKKHMVRRSPNT